MKCIAYCRRCGFTTSLDGSDAPEWRNRPCQSCFGPLRVMRCTIRIGL